MSRLGPPKGPELRDRSRLGMSGDGAAPHCSSLDTAKIEVRDKSSLADKRRTSPRDASAHRQVGLRGSSFSSFSSSWQRTAIKLQLIAIFPRAFHSTAGRAGRARETARHRGAVEVTVIERTSPLRVPTSVLSFDSVICN